MLEKLLYKDAKKANWDFDITMSKEAEAFLNEMAAQGYELKWTASGEGCALFVKSKPGEEKAYSVTVIEAEKLSEEEAYQQFAAEAGWTYICTTEDCLSIFASPRRDALPPLDTDQQVTLEVVETVSRDKGRVGGNVIAGLCFLALGYLRFANTDTLSRTDFLGLYLFVGIGLLYLCTAYLNWLSMRRLRARVIEGAEMKLFCTSKIQRWIHQGLLLFYVAVLPIFSWLDHWADPMRVSVYTLCLILGYLLVIEIEPLVKPSWQKAVGIIYMVLIVLGALIFL